MKIHVNSISKALLLIATFTLLHAATARADDGKAGAPPSAMEGGVPVDLVDPNAMNEKPSGLEKVPAGDKTALQITTDEACSVELAVIEKPTITSPRYLVKGWIKYEGVEGDGYMEMWNHFGEQSYFSRTLGDGKGPMGKITGTSGWRVFLLPFTAEEGMKPDRLEINLVLAGKGKVTVTDVRLVDIGAVEKGLGAAWWTQRQSGWIGGGVGCFGALLGMLASLLARRSSHGSILLAKGALVVGAALGIVAIVAVSLGQPWHVWYLFALVGVILMFAFGARLPSLKRETTALELRRMHAVDA